MPEQTEKTREGTTETVGQHLFVLLSVISQFLHVHIGVDLNVYVYAGVDIEVDVDVDVDVSVFVYACITMFSYMRYFAL